MLSVTEISAYLIIIIIIIIIIMMMMLTMMLMLCVGGVYIMSGPRNVTVADGGTARLDCDVDADPDNISVSWLLDEHPIVATSRSALNRAFNRSIMNYF